MGNSKAAQLTKTTNKSKSTLIATENLKVEYLEKSLERYGKVQIVEKKTDNPTYIFTCYLNKITDDKVLKALNQLIFMVKLDGFVVTLFCFCIMEGLDEKEKADVLDVINDVNAETQYGRFFVDEDNDLDWQFSYDQGESIEDIKLYLQSCAEGILNITMKLRDRSKDEK